MKTTLPKTCFRTGMAAALLLSAASLPAQAQNENENMYSDLTGIYVGGNVGYGMGSFGINDPAGPDGDVGMDGLSGGLFIGYGYNHDFGWFGGYAGLEAAYEWSDVDGRLGGSSYSKDDSWNITFRPGVSLLKDAVGYGIIGYSRAEFEGNGTDDDLDGFMAGIGTELDTSTAIKTRLEFVYTNYEDTNLGGVNFDGHESALKLGVLFKL